MEGIDIKSLVSNVGAGGGGAAAAGGGTAGGDAGGADEGILNFFVVRSVFNLTMHAFSTS